MMVRTTCTAGEPGQLNLKGDGRGQVRTRSALSRFSTASRISDPWGLELNFSETIAISPDCRDVDAAVIENVRCNVRRLRDNEGALGRAIAEGRVVVHGAVHDLVSGELRPVEDAAEGG